MPEFHISHLEDLIFDRGYAGAEQSLRVIDNIRESLFKGGTNDHITVKWDGSPAIICGIDPEDGKFFVGTKSVFAKSPKIIKRPRDIKEFYSDNADLSKKLYYALKYLPQLDIGGVVQGDLLFIHDDLSVDIIDGTRHVTFTPNTITYAIKSTSDLAKQVKKAKLGIVFHTSFVGETLSDMEKQPGVSIAGFQATPEVWFDDSRYNDVSGRATLTDGENNSIIASTNNIRRLLKQAGKKKFDKFFNEADCGTEIKQFINRNVRLNTQIDDVMGFVGKFIKFYTDKKIDEINNLKTSNAKTRKTNKFNNTVEYIEDNVNIFAGIMAIYKQIILVKHFILDKLNTIETIGTFFKEPSGYKVTNQEGFVAISTEGNVVKLTDRLEFNRENFKKWKE